MRLAPFIISPGYLAAAGLEQVCHSGLLKNPEHPYRNLYRQCNSARTRNMISISQLPWFPRKQLFFYLKVYGKLFSCREDPVSKFQAKESLK